MHAQAKYFNVGKKLGQLIKVIDLLSSQNADRDFQIESLNEKYSYLIEDYLKDYTNEMIYINKVHQEQEEEVSKALDQEYKQKHIDQRNEFEGFIVSQQNSISRMESQKIREISSIEEEISKITMKIQDDQNDYDNKLSEFKTNYANKVTWIKQNYIKEVESHDKESDNRMKLLMQFTQQQLDFIMTEHKKSLKELEHSMKNDISMKGIVDQQNESLLIKCKEAKNNLKATSLDFQKYILEQNKKIHERREKMKDLVERHNNLIKNHEDEMEKLDGEYKMTDENWINSIITLKKKRATLASQYLADIARHRAEKEQKYLSFQQELEDEYKRNKMTQERLESGSQSLTDQHRRELENIRDMHEKAMQEESERQKRKHEEILKKQEEYRREVYSFQGKLSQLRISNDQELLKLKNQHQSEIQDLEFNFVNVRSSIEKDIDSMLESKDSEAHQLANRLKQTEEEKNQEIINFKNKLVDFEKDFLNEKESLGISTGKSLTALESRNSTEIINQMNIDNEEYEELEKKLNKEYEEMMNESERLYNKEIEELVESSKDHSEIDSLVKDYEQKVNDKIAEILSIQAPDCSRIFEQYDKEEQELTQKHLELEQSIKEESIDIDSKYRSKIKEEEERHASFFVRCSIGHEKEERAVRLLKELSGFRDTRESEELTMNQMIIDITNQHKNEMKHHNIDLESSKSIVEVEKLKRILTNLREDLKKKSNNQENELLNKLEGINYMKDDEMKSFNKKKSEIQQRQKEVDNKYMIEQHTFETKINLSAESHKKRISEENGSYLCFSHTHTQDYQKRITKLKDDESELTNKLDQSKAVQDKIYTEKIAQHDFTINELITKSTNEIDTKKKNWDEMLKVYVEKIENLINERDKVREQAENAPPREEDISKISILEDQVKLLTSQLQCLVKELVDYQKMNKIKDQEFNKRFGKNPNVGVLTPRSKTPR